jgi:hypothetical protein
MTGREIHQLRIETLSRFSCRHCAGLLSLVVSRLLRTGTESREMVLKALGYQNKENARDILHGMTIEGPEHSKILYP